MGGPCPTWSGNGSSNSPTTGSGRATFRASCASATAACPRYYRDTTKRAASRRASSAAPSRRWPPRRWWTPSQPTSSRTQRCSRGKSVTSCSRTASACTTTSPACPRSIGSEIRHYGKNYSKLTFLCFWQNCSQQSGGKGQVQLPHGHQHGRR